MAQELVFIERQVDVNLVVGMEEVSTTYDAIEVIVLVPTSIGGAGGSAGVTWLYASGIVGTPLNGFGYEFDTRVQAGALLLPATPPDGFRVYVRDGYGTFGTNPVNVEVAVGSGQTISQLPAEEALTLDYPHRGEGFLFRYRIADSSWSW